MSAIIPTKAKAIAIPASSNIATADGFRKYLQTIAKFPMLTAKEEFDLSMRWREHGDVEAAHQLVTSHLRLVPKLASKYRGYGLPMAELIAEGNIGLMQAVKRFEPKRGFRLTTYAIWWIKASMQEYILRSWSLVKVGSSAAQKRMFFNLRKLKKKMGTAHNLELGDAQVVEIAAMLDVSAEDVVDMDRRMTAADVYLNAPMGHEDGDAEKMDFLADEGMLHDEVIANQQEAKRLNTALTKALGTLNERERNVLIKRRLQESPSTLEELSVALGISRERVRQIEVRAFEKLQKAMLAAAKAA
jgi:RNA polymerase sigma-32 factor